MWHVSVRHPNIFRARDLCYRELLGVGDALLGEWTEVLQSFHLRRRLSAAEELRVGPVVDIRGTPEAERRWKASPAAVRRLTGQPL